MAFLSEIAGKVRGKFQHGLALKWTFDRLCDIGLRVSPFYVVLEGCDVCETPGVSDRFGEYEETFLEEKDMAQLDRIDGRDETAQELIDRLASGDICVGFKKSETIVAFMWLDLVECNDEYIRFPLAENEAYLYDMYTIKAYRGKNIAANARYRVYQLMKAKGRNRLYSISERFNQPSIRFKQKLGARYLKYQLSLRFFNKYSVNWLLTDFTKASPLGVPIS